VRKYWHRPQPSERVAVAEKDAEATTRAALDAMLTRPWRVGRLPPAEEYALLLARASHWVRRGEPIRVTMGYAPMKNPVAVPYQRADWAEFFALSHLCAWHNKVCGAYPPGLKIKIIFDDSTIEMANRQSTRVMEPYMTSIASLVKAMGYESLIVKTMRQSWFAWLFHFGFYQWARVRLRRWERDPANQPVIDQMFESAQRNVLPPEGLGPEARERFFRDAAHRYRLYCEALCLSRFARFGHALIAMYMDGSQHHVRQTPALHLASVAKEQVTQPWQGQGCLLDNGRGTLVPWVLTAGRRERIIVEEQAGLDLVQGEGFDRIPICREAPPSCP
jgi:hypothetical protein